MVVILHKKIAPYTTFRRINDVRVCSSFYVESKQQLCIVVTYYDDDESSIFLDSESAFYCVDDDKDLTNHRLLRKK